MSVFSSYISELADVCTSPHEEYLSSLVDKIAHLICNADKHGKLTVIFGNGGSAADAQHWVGELVCTYHDREREPLGAIALTCNSSVITAWANDKNYEDVFKRQIRSLSKLLGLAIGLSTSGRSANVLEGLKEAKFSGASTVLISGSGVTDIYDFVDTHLVINSVNTPIIQTLTQIVYHSICELVDLHFKSKESP